MDDKKTIEKWAEEKGMLPRYLQAAARLGQHRATMTLQNPRYVDFARAKAHARWPEGKEVTESEFDEAVTTSVVDLR